ncbi:MAG: FixH family protein [Saprospiraceae bacterium]
MKKIFNPGTLVLLVAGGFLVFIFSLMYIFTRQNLSLVSEHYYEEELNYDQKKEATLNANLQGDQFYIEKDSNGIILHVPATISALLRNSYVNAYFPSNNKYDQAFKLKPNLEGLFLLSVINESHLPYTLQVNLNDGQKEYYKLFTL